MNRSESLAHATAMHEKEAAHALLYGTDRPQDLALDPSRFRPTYICAIGG